MRMDLVNYIIMYALMLTLLALIDVLVFVIIGWAFRSRLMKMWAAIDHMDNCIFFLIIPFLTFLFCCPLLYVCLYGGDVPAIKRGGVDLWLCLIPILPVIGIALAAKRRKLQVILFVFFASVFFLEIGDGITATSQLNHEGSDSIFLFAHGVFFLLAILIIAIVCSCSLLMRVFNLKKII